MKRWIKLQILESEIELLKMASWYFCVLGVGCNIISNYAWNLWEHNDSIRLESTSKYKKIKKGK